MKFSVIVTQESNKRLEETLLGLKKDATGYFPGLNIKKIQEVYGKYAIEYHRGTITDNIYSVRIIDRQIITIQKTDLIKMMLRKNKIAFKEYEDVVISLEEANSKKPKIDLQNREPNLIYNL